jgi:hypothetical protein
MNTNSFSKKIKKQACIRTKKAVKDKILGVRDTLKTKSKDFKEK